MLMCELQCEPYFLCGQKTLMLLCTKQSHSFSKQKTNSQNLQVFDLKKIKIIFSHLIEKKINDVKI